MYNHIIIQNKMSNLMSQITSSDVLDRAYAWLYAKRKTSNSKNDFWKLSFSWPKVKRHLRHKLLSGNYHLSPLKIFTSKDGQTISLYTPCDSIVLKAISLVITPLITTKLNLSSAAHLEGNGGLKGAVNMASAYAKRHKFTFKSDIGDYYASMDHHTLHSQLCQIINDKRVQRLLWYVMDRVHVRGGEYRTVKHKSIPRGCPLSPLFSALYLESLDAYARNNNLNYVRYMDDFVFFAKSRYQLRRIIKKVYTIINPLGLKLAPLKTYIGKVKKSFSFLGYQISHKGIGIAKITLDRFKAKCCRLYEQGASKQRLVAYVKRWVQWVKGGVVLLKDTLNINNNANLFKTLRSWVLMSPIHGQRVTGSI